MLSKDRIIIVASLFILAITFSRAGVGQIPVKGTAEASKSYFGEPVCETIVAGDVNSDCKVNFKDFALMAFHWLEKR